MCKIDIIRASWLSNPVGPSRTLNRIIKNKSYFESRGYNVEVFTMDRICPRDIMSFRNAHISFKHRAKMYIKQFTKYSRLLSRIFIERETFYYGKQIVDYYLKLNRDADIIVFHDFFSCYYYHLINKGSVKTVLFYHNNGAAFDALLYYYPAIKESKYYKELLSREQFIISKINKMVFIAEYGQHNFSSIYPDCEECKLTTIHNGIDDVRTLPKSTNEEYIHKYRFVCSGTINERKGQHLIVEALSELDKSTRQQIHVTFIGDGNKKHELEEFVRQHGLQDNVLFLGVIDNEDIHQYLSNANIYILMSYEEGLPLSIIEALRSGLGVVATRIAGIPELVKENYNGILLNPDKDELKSVLDSIKYHDWDIYGKRSRDLFEKEFTFDKMMQRYCDMLDNLCVKS